MDRQPIERLQLPKDFHLLPGETLVNVEAFEPLRLTKKPSSLREMHRLTSAYDESEVGAHGPAIASLASEYRTEASEHQGLFEVDFGRDSLRVAIDLARHYPKLVRATVRKFAEAQGTVFNTAREEEPGKTAHEIRDVSDPKAIELTKTRGWGWPYYGSVDATPEFIRTLYTYCELSEKNTNFLSEQYVDRDNRTHTIADALTGAVNWLTGRMDSNPEGLLEYKSVLPRGIENQVWKDSWDAYHHSDGTIANHDQGIASIEVQTVSYEALLNAADLYENVLDRKHEAAALRDRADHLAETILRLFWTDDKGGYFVLGTDRDDEGKPRQLKIRTSNMGHVLNSRILDSDDSERVHKRAAILRQLQSPELLTVSGIRTLASDEVRFREGAYHNGSVWIWDTHHIAKGARRYQSDPEFALFADDLDNRILRVVNTLNGFPEFVRGGNEITINTHIIDVRDDATGHINRIEQPPQDVQAWTVAAILAVKLLNKR